MLDEQPFRARRRSDIGNMPRCLYLLSHRPDRASGIILLLTYDIDAAYC